MANTRGTPAVTGWQEHNLLRDLALGEESPEQLAEKYGLAVQTVYDRRWKNKHRINAILAEWSNEFSDLWAVKKHARVADLLADHDSLQERQDELLEDAERATEVMRRVDPEATPVRVPVREWRALVRDKAKLKDQIAREMGQLPEHAGALGGNTHLLNFMGLRPGKETIDHTKFLALRPDEQTVYRGMPETAQALFLKLTPVQRDWFPLEGSFREQYDYLVECTENDFEKRERLRRNQVMDDLMAKWLADHPSESDDVAPVEEPDLVKDEDEPVELFRATPPPPAPEPEVDPVPDPVAVVEPEPEPEPELPPVEDAVVQAARRLSIQIWSGVTVLRAQLAPTNDQALAHAVAMEWLAVAGALVVRGGVDPRPVSVTRIPNF